MEDARKYEATLHVSTRPSGPKEEAEYILSSSPEVRHHTPRWARHKGSRSLPLTLDKRKGECTSSGCPRPLLGRLHKKKKKNLKSNDSCQGRDGWFPTHRKIIRLGDLSGFSVGSSVDCRSTPQPGTKSMSLVRTWVSSTSNLYVDILRHGLSLEKHVNLIFKNRNL